MIYKDTEEYISKYKRVLGHAEICYDLLYDYEIEGIVENSPLKIKEQLDYDLWEEDSANLALDPYYGNELEALQQRCERLAYQYEIHNENNMLSQQEIVRLREYPEVNLRIQSIQRILNLNDEKDIAHIEADVRRISSKHKKRPSRLEGDKFPYSNSEELFLANLNLAYNVAKSKSLSSGVPFLDMLMEACIELYECAKTYDLSRGFTLNSLYRSYIFQKLNHISHKYQDHGIKLPLAYYSLLNKISKIYTYFYNENGYYPSPMEISMEFSKLNEDVPIENLADVLKFSQPEFISLQECLPISKDILYDEDDGLIPPYFHEMIFDSDTVGDQELLQESLKSEVRRVIQKYLHSQRKEIVKMFFGIDHKEMDLKEIGDFYGITKERARQLKEDAIKHLKGHKSKLLKCYLAM